MSKLYSTPRELGLTYDKMLADVEVKALLKVSADSRKGWRDHMIWSLALATGLRRDELRGLNFEDLWAYGSAARRHQEESNETSRVERKKRGLVSLEEGDGWTCGAALPRQVIQLRVFKASNPDPSQQVCALNPRVRHKLKRYRSEMARRGYGIGPSDPLFVSNQRARISNEALHKQFKRWLRLAGIERNLSFHALRHTAISAVYRATKDLRVTQRFARHSRIESTMIYMHPTMGDIEGAVVGLLC